MTFEVVIIMEIAVSFPFLDKSKKKLINSSYSQLFALRSAESSISFSVIETTATYIQRQLFLNCKFGAFSAFR